MIAMQHFHIKSGKSLRETLVRFWNRFCHFGAQRQILGASGFINAMEQCTKTINISF
jgi:hypothetical protein